MIAPNTALKNGMIQIRDFLAGGGTLTTANVATFFGVSQQVAGQWLLNIYLHFGGFGAQTPGGPGDGRELFLQQLDQAIKDQQNKGA